ncbi:MAG: hypothetical protein H0U22_01680 [Geodermatophilaceae bacterium]|nr:hypothetical protein [Geodermatophilaceae bacterium]
MIATGRCSTKVGAAQRSTSQRRAVARLGDIGSRDAQDLATLVVAVRVLRGMLAQS